MYFMKEPDTGIGKENEHRQPKIFGIRETQTDAQQNLIHMSIVFSFELFSEGLN